MVWRAGTAKELTSTHRPRLIARLRAGSALKICLALASAQHKPTVLENADETDADEGAQHQDNRRGKGNYVCVVNGEQGDVTGNGVDQRYVEHGNAAARPGI